jgi:hypothetical protein
VEYINHTRFPSFLFRTCIDDTRIAASLLLRITYDIRDGMLVASAEQPWITSSCRVGTIYGVMPNDQVFYRGGVDVLVFGSAYAVGDGKASQVDVEVEVGNGFRRKARVFGRRIWLREKSGLVPSAPEPFVSIPLTVGNSYGGKEPLDGVDIPCTDNPDGVGFYMTEAYAEGRPLPCIEDPENLIKKWDERPSPVGFGFIPENSTLQKRKVLQFDDVGNVSCNIPALFNAAFPDMVVPRVLPGDPVRISGMSPAHPIWFRLPNTLPCARARIDALVVEQPMAIDQIGVEVERSRVFVSYRFPFRYVIRPTMRRIFEVFFRS